MTRVHPKSSLGPLVPTAVQTSASSSDDKPAFKRWFVAHCCTLQRDSSINSHKQQKQQWRILTAILWLVVFTLQLANIPLLLLMIYGFFGYRQRGSFLGFIRKEFLFADATIFLERYYTQIGATYAVILLLYVYWSYQLVRVWCVDRDHQSDQSSRRDRRKRKSASKRPFCWLRLKATRCGAIFQRARRHLILTYNLFDVDGVLYDVRIMVSEAVEVTSQIVAAYNCSHYISNRAFNETYGILIFMNCLSMPILHLLCRDVVVRRFCIIFLDSFLDFTWASVLQGWLINPYEVMHYRTWAGAIDSRLQAASVYPEHFAQEVQQVIPLSYSNWFLSIWPFIEGMSNVNDLRSLKALLKVNRSITPTAVGVTSRKSLRRLSEVSQKFAKTRTRVQQSVDSQRFHRLTHTFHAILAAIGITVLWLSVRAQSVESNVMYDPSLFIYQVYPWGASTKVFVARKIDCSRSKDVNDTYYVERELQRSDRNTIKSLSISNCHALDISPTLLDFRYLKTLTINATSVASWSNDVPVGRFEKLQTIIITNTTFSTPPVGLVEKPLAHAMERILLRGVDGAPLFADVGSNWQQLRTFECDDCALTRVPDIVREMPHLTKLSLRYNTFGELEESYVLPPQLRSLRLSGNPLKTLPTVWWHQIALLEDVSLESTNLTTLGPMKEDLTVSDGLNIYLNGTSLCGANDQFLGLKFVVCKADLLI